jgi:hypothetical protein
MGAPNDQWILEQQADSLEALSSALYYSGMYEEASILMSEAADILRGTKVAMDKPESETP